MPLRLASRWRFCCDPEPLHIPAPVTHPAVKNSTKDEETKLSILITVDALNDLPAIEGLAVELATVGGCDCCCERNNLYGALFRARSTHNYAPDEGNRHDRNRFNEVLDSYCPARAPGRLDQEGSLTQHEPAAPVTNMSHPPDRYVVTVEVMVQAWTADEAAQVVRAFVTDVFARSKYKLGNVHAINTEPPGDETWHRALDCAGALG
jgi:hypothetical protein